ncbi:MAG: Alpha/beta hydrolase fold-3 domain protein [Phenylobacterium sp.]|nr:Alpha/beta hydrolase fold-3 domain protein [Phenylobacterium sp.]
MRSRVLALVIGCSFAALGPPALAQTATGAPAPLPMRAYVPTTISPEAAAIYAGYKAFVMAPTPAIPTTAAGFEALYQANEKRSLSVAETALKTYGSTASDRVMGGTPTVEVRPRGYKDDGSVLIYVHGGGFISGSARSNLLGPAIMDDATGRRVISVEYAVAPRGQFPLVTDQVAAVYKALLAQGVKPGRIGMFGGSAGGTIVAATALKIRDQGLPMPAALLLQSPATDLTGAGDTRITLSEADPALRPGTVQPGIDAYAPPSDQRNPYASPVYGDFKKGYPPTLIQGGTKEFLLSDFVRLHRAIRGAGGDSRLEIYEGMPHGFSDLMVNTPEGREAKAEAVAFWNQHLAGPKRR